jgi:Tol biopolymer transport system component
MMNSRPRREFARMAGAGLLALAGAACADPVSPSATPQPQDQILFLRHADGNSVSIYSEARMTDIYLMNADGSGVQNLTNLPAGYASPSLSPDGAKVAFASTRSGTTQVWAMNTDGSGLTQLTNLRHATAPRWSPDGSFIAFLGYGADYRDHVYVMNADGTDPRNVSSPAVGSCSEGDTRTRIELIGWIPDGRVAFSRYVCREGYRFYTVKADGSGFTRTDFNLNSAYWSPDGSRVAFTRWEDGQTRLFVMNADGSGVRRLDGAGSASLPDRTRPYARADYTPWSRDGTRIVFSGQGCSAWVIHADGSGLRQLADTPCQAFAFQGWSPGGDRLAFTGWKDGRIDVYTVKPDGTGLVNLTHSPVPLSAALWVPRR